MKRLLATLAAALAVFLFVVPGPASAHPLGNFTVNRHVGIELAGSRVYLRYVLDLAEIPAFQLGDEVRDPGYPARIVRDLVLTLDGRRVELRPLERRLASRPGAGGLEVIRLDVVYGGDASGTKLAFTDRSFEGRSGWREVTLSARDGARVLAADVPSTSPSDRLRSYPRDVLRSPADVSSARATVWTGGSPGVPPRIEGVGETGSGGGGFEALIQRGDVTPGVLALTLLIAMFWGAAHALTPGHGKALVAAYLVGAKGRPRHALLLAGTVTVAHTAGVFALGIVTLGLSQLVVPEALYPWLTLASGLLVVAVGAAVLGHRLRGTHGLGHRPGHHHGHEHSHDHDHQEQRLARTGILGVGIAAGLLPCPSALVVLLSAIALHRIGLGLLLIVAFSLGLAATITGIGLLAVLARRAFGRLSLDGPVVRALPAVSAGLILLVGLAITARALPGVV